MNQHIHAGQAMHLKSRRNLAANWRFYSPGRSAKLPLRT
jgi:hypothetical protein